MAFQRIGIIGGSGLGQALGQLTHGQEHSLDTPFGKVVAHFQAVAFSLADMAMDVDSARSTRREVVRCASRAARRGFRTG